MADPARFKDVIISDILVGERQCLKDLEQKRNFQYDKYLFLRQKISQLTAEITNINSRYIEISEENNRLNDELIAKKGTSINDKIKNADHTVLTLAAEKKQQEEALQDSMEIKKNYTIKIKAADFLFIAASKLQTLWSNHKNYVESPEFHRLLLKKSSELIDITNFKEDINQFREIINKSKNDKAKSDYMLAQTITALCEEQKISSPVPGSEIVVNGQPLSKILLNQLKKITRLDRKSDAEFKNILNGRTKLKEIIEKETKYRAEVAQLKLTASNLESEIKNLEKKIKSNKTNLEDLYGQLLKMKNEKEKLDGVFLKHQESMITVAGQHKDQKIFIEALVDYQSLYNDHEHCRMTDMLTFFKSSIPSFLETFSSFKKSMAHFNTHAQKFKYFEKLEKYEHTLEVITIWEAKLKSIEEEFQQKE